MVNIKNVSIKDIVFYENNPRKNDKAVAVVAASIKDFGFKVPVVLTVDNVIVCGHTRIRAAEKLGMTHVPCVIADDLTDAQIKAFRVADNRTHEFSEWDMEKLAAELSDLADLDIDMSAFDFAFADSGMKEDNFDVDEVIKDIIEPKTKQGDVWALGTHRLMCGDATVREDVLSLMGGKLADMIFTDPPYNVDYEGGTKEKLKIKNDKMTNDKFYQFLYNSFLNMFSVVGEGGAFYVCHADSEGLNFRKALVDAGWSVKQCIIWVKNAIVMGRQDHHWQHEPILYGWKPGGKHNWYGGRKQSTVLKAEDGVFVVKAEDGYHVTFNNGLRKIMLVVPDYKVAANIDDACTTTWHIDKPLKNGEHPTMKPVTLCVRAIKNSSKAGDSVLDLFSGAGSTLIACEQLGRVCYAMELDPKYCDVIVRRWEEYTGLSAEIIR